MNGDGLATSGKKTQFIACPACDARFTFFRNPTPKINSCGFESYSLECKECKVGLTGIIDPNGQELLLAKFTSENAVISRPSTSSPRSLPDCGVVRCRE
jgi:hypothetical protein